MWAHQTGVFYITEILEKNFQNTPILREYISFVLGPNEVTKF